MNRYMMANTTSKRRSNFMVSARSAWWSSTCGVSSARISAMSSPSAGAAWPPSPPALDTSCSASSSMLRSGQYSKFVLAPDMISSDDRY